MARHIYQKISLFLVDILSLFILRQNKSSEFQINLKQI